jgi:pSer/pThr/pTyr-binding forkhead associated (FHA) protein
MAAKVKLEVTSGTKQGSVFSFDSRDPFVFGRHPDCHAGLGIDPRVSRHHFLLEANPPDMRVRDLGSRNGTFVNGTKHGDRAANESAGEAAGRVYPSIEGHEVGELPGKGDQPQIGKRLKAVLIADAWQIRRSERQRAGQQLGNVENSIPITRRGLRSGSPRA